MSINLILNNAVSGLNTSQSALGEVANNVANVNTPNYARREIDQAAVTIAGQSAGVEISEVRRVVDRFLQQQTFEASSALSQYEELSRIHDRLQAVLGRPDGDTTLSARLNGALSAAADLVTDPTSTVRRTAYLDQLRALASSFSQLADEVQRLRADADQRIAATVTDINTQLARIDDLNSKIARQTLSGQSAAGLNDQLDQALNELSQLIDIRTDRQSDGSVHVSTANGFTLVGTGRVELSYDATTAVTATSTFPSVIALRLTSTGDPVSGPGVALDSEIGAGALRGLLDIRDTELPQIADQLGELAGTVADAINAEHNANTAVPPPNVMTGLNTGLIGTDAAGFTGAATFAVVDGSGTLVRRVDVDFTAGTYSVDGGGAVAFGGTTVADMVAAINTGLGGDGTLTFAAGQMTLSADDPANGIAVLPDGTSPATRAGRGFSHFFGLNDVLGGHRPTHFETGLGTGDAHSFTPGQTLDLRVRNGAGEVVASASITVGGTSFADILTDLNDSATGLGSVMTFSLSPTGALVATPVSGSDLSLDVVGDGTARSGSGTSFTDLFGLGTGRGAERARSLDLLDTLRGNPQGLALARPDLDPAAVPGDFVLGPGDNRGALALQGLSSAQVGFSAAGRLGASTATLGDHVARVLADLGNRAASAESASADAEALSNEVRQRRDEVQGVNIDEELATLLVYQQAYNASARMIQAAQELYDTLINVV